MHGRTVGAEVKEGTEWDVRAALILYRRVAERSLAYWLDGKGCTCHGTGTASRMIRQPSKGIGRVAIGGGGF